MKKCSCFFEDAHSVEVFPFVSLFLMRSFIEKRKIGHSQRNGTSFAKLYNDFTMDFTTSSMRETEIGKTKSHPNKMYCLLMHDADRFINIKMISTDNHKRRTGYHIDSINFGKGISLEILPIIGRINCHRKYNQCATKHSMKPIKTDPQPIKSN